MNIVNNAAMNICIQVLCDYMLSLLLGIYLAVELLGYVVTLSLTSFLSSSENMLINFRGRGREGEREGEKHRCERETSISATLYMPQPGTKPTTQP